MTVKEVLNTVASMPQEDWMEIQNGIAKLLASEFSRNDRAEINSALEEAESEFARGEGLQSLEIRRRLELP
jgi:hypothetical protein